MLKPPAWTANLPPDTPWFEADLQVSGPGLTPQEFVDLINGILMEIENRTRGATAHASANWSAAPGCGDIKSLNT
ncbi:hypothetical protein GCM10022255_098250 [Dactylosporangium darangshiense]|uniref:Uncharacterized protein n=1 Tax=Dactylosporangium darangshiense TaxID=579108 RepID=A0ABP8DRE5_9ACTN